MGGATGPHGSVFQVVALIKPFRAKAVLEAIQALPIHGGTVREAMGFGRQKRGLHRYLGSEYNASFIPKVELTLYVDEEHVPATLRAIVGAARTGRMGDGKILVVRTEEPAGEDSGSDRPARQ
jgi:nitrogen regulatory protein PII